VFTDRQLFQLAQSKVTISTVAPTPQAFAELAQAPVTLAWSVHAANDALRKRMVPTTKYSMVELRQGLVEALSNRRSQSPLRTTMIEMALIDHINDSEQDAQDLADFCKGLVREVMEQDKQKQTQTDVDTDVDAVDAKPIKLVVNLIPWNDIDSGEDTPPNPLGYRKPTDARVRAFQKVLTDRGVFTFVRTTRGDDESAACGQLATTSKNQKNKEKAQTQANVSMV
jgi:23S rRNA (adenine2503-C2)-methyltransferase